MNSIFLYQHPPRCNIQPIKLRQYFTMCLLETALRINISFSIVQLPCGGSALLYQYQELMPGAVYFKLIVHDCSAHDTVGTSVYNAHCGGAYFYLSLSTEAITHRQAQAISSVALLILIFSGCLHVAPIVPLCPVWLSSNSTHLLCI